GVLRARAGAGGSRAVRRRDRSARRPPAGAPRSGRGRAAPDLPRAGDVRGARRPARRRAALRGGDGPAAHRRAPSRRPAGTGEAGRGRGPRRGHAPLLRPLPAAAEAGAAVPAREDRRSLPAPRRRLPRGGGAGCRARGGAPARRAGRHPGPRARARRAAVNPGRSRSARVATLLAPLLLLAAPAAQQARPTFTVDRSADPPLVAADCNGVTCDRALVELGTAMGWRVDFETRQLEAALAATPIDLAFAGQPPRIIAHLIAAAGGADVVFDDRTEEETVRTRVHVVSPASAEQESGRRRLRQWAIQWYQSFLSGDNLYDPLVQEEGMRVRMQLAQIRLQQGDVEGA